MFLNNLKNKTIVENNVNAAWSKQFDSRFKNFMEYISFKN